PLHQRSLESAYISPTLLSIRGSNEVLPNLDRADLRIIQHRSQRDRDLTTTDRHGVNAICGHVGTATGRTWVEVRVNGRTVNGDVEYSVTAGGEVDLRELQRHHVGRIRHAEHVLQG